MASFEQFVVIARGYATNKFAESGPYGLSRLSLLWVAATKYSSRRSLACPLLFGLLFLLRNLPLVLSQRNHRARFHPVAGSITALVAALPAFVPTTRFIRNLKAATRAAPSFRC